MFGPEHGFRGTAQAGGSEGRYDDPATGLPVYDTYLKNGRDLADVFTASGVDTVLFDIQDAGARFYTYIWTLYDCLEAAALAGKRVVVLDRPNPVTGREALGPVLDPAFGTFVGRREIAQAHGMTVAELALFFNAEFFHERPARLDVVTMSGWRRSDFFDATGLPWVPPSPNMPTPETAVVYPAPASSRARNLSEGRGTTRPFELLGAEGVDHRWAAAANALRLPGCLPRGVLRADLLQVRGEDGGRGAGARARPGGVRPGPHRDRPARHGEADVERFRLAAGQLDRQAHRQHPGPHDDRRGRGHRRGGTSVAAGPVGVPGEAAEVPAVRG